MGCLCDARYGKKFGYGVFTSSDGSTFAGQFKDDVMDSLSISVLVPIWLIGCAGPT